jgi:lipoyl(octanoyl) transferase
MAYRPAWDYQVQVHERVVAGEEERVLFVEHEPVITFGRRPGVAKNLVASQEQLAELGVEVVESDRGGDITFHGPGQIVVYPIIRLADHGLSISGYVHRLEAVVVDALKQIGITNAAPDSKAPGVWVPSEGAAAKVCAVGVRIRRGVSMHGIALNVATDLRYFELIVPCGLAGRPVSTLQKLLGETAPSMAEMRERLQAAFVRGFP